MPESSTKEVVGRNIASGELSATFVKPERELVHEFVTEYLHSARKSVAYATDFGKELPP